MNFTDLHRNINELIKNIDSIAIEAAMEEKETIADLNVKQLEEGKRSDGKSITPKYRSPVYATYKKAIGAKPPKFTPDLKVKGNFHSGIYADRKNNYIYNWSSDEKADKLNAYYPMIFGITLDHQAYLNRLILPKIQNRSRDVLTRS